MAKHLQERDVDRIVGLLDGWSGKLTWESVSAASAKLIGTQPARQTLYRAKRVREAFNRAKVRLKATAIDVRLPPTMQAAAERIARLQADNARLQVENRGLLERFAVWQYNAHIAGLSDRDLERSLPAIDRGRTD